MKHEEKTSLITVSLRQYVLKIGTGFSVVLFILISLNACVHSTSDGQITGTAKHISKEPVIPREANRIVIDPITNRTENPDIPDILDTRIRESLRKHGRLTTVSPDNKPDISLDIIVKEYSVQNIKIDRHSVALKKRMRVSVLVTLTDINADRIILKNSAVSAYREFSEITVPAETERTALNLLLSHLADRITARITTGWYTEHMTPVEKGQR